MDVSIIIVNYNTKELTKNCLKSIYENTKDISFEVIVSDNGSADGSIEMIKSEFPQVALIENSENLGFGKANNRGLKIAKGKYIFYLNSDTVLLNNAVKMFFDYWENAENKDEIGALGCFLTKNSKQIHSFGMFPTKTNILKYFFRCCISSSFVGSLYRKFKKVKKEIENVSCSQTVNGYITGADLFLKNDVDAIYDEQYFMYFEESDLQFNNFHKKNKKIFVIDTPKIEHLEGGSEKLHSEGYSFKKITSFYYWQSAILYFKKNFNSVFFVLILKILLTFEYLNPFNLSKTYKYLGMIWKV